MRIVIQRVNKACVMVGQKKFSEIGRGLFVLVGIHTHDTKLMAEVLAEKLRKLRVMPDDNGKMNLTLADTRGSLMLVSQFTLYADTQGSNRPSFSNAAGYEVAQPIYEHFVEKLKDGNGMNVQTGKFREHMDIDLELDGPVTIIIEN